MKLKNIVKTAVFTAIIACCSLITIPMPSGMPITLQTLAISFSGFILGSWYGVFAVLAYIALGLIGVPVFSGFQSGIGVFAGVTGGFIIGFIFLVAFSGLNIKNKYIKILFSFVGLILCHVIGTAWFAYLSQTDFLKAFLIVSLPYFVKDVVSVVVAYIVFAKIAARYPEALINEKPPFEESTLTE